MCPEWSSSRTTRRDAAMGETRADGSRSPLTQRSGGNERCGAWPSLESLDEPDARFARLSHNAAANVRPHNEDEHRGRDWPTDFPRRDRPEECEGKAVGAGHGTFEGTRPRQQHAGQGLGQGGKGANFSQLNRGPPRSRPARRRPAAPTLPHFLFKPILQEEEKERQNVLSEIRAGGGGALARSIPRRAYSNGGETIRIVLPLHLRVAGEGGRPGGPAGPLRRGGGVCRFRSSSFCRPAWRQYMQITHVAVRPAEKLAGKPAGNRRASEGGKPCPVLHCPAGSQLRGDRVARVKPSPPHRAAPQRGRVGLPATVGEIRNWVVLLF